MKNINDADSTKHNHTLPIIDNIDNSDTDSRVNSDPLTSDSEPNNTNVSSGNACLDTCPIANDKDLTHFISEQNEEGLIYKGYRFLKKPSKAKSTCLFRCESNSMFKCTARFTTDLKHSITRDVYKKHTHPPPGSSIVVDAELTQAINPELVNNPIVPIIDPPITVDIIDPPITVDIVDPPITVDIVDPPITVDIIDVPSGPVDHSDPPKTDLDNVRVFTTHKGNVGIQVGDARFIRKHEYPLYSVFKCSVSKCNAICKTTPLHDVTSVTNPCDHNHAKHATKWVRDSLRDKVLDLARNRPNDLPTDIVDDAIEAFDAYFSQTDYETLKRAINRDRLSNRPKLPRDRNQVFEALKEAKGSPDLKGADMIKGIDRASGVAMFYSDRNLALLNGHSPKQIFGDGTFKYTSSYFYQMYSFHIYKNGYYIPVCHFLLPNKLGDSYIIVLEMLQKACRGLGFEIDIDMFTVDLEAGMVKAIKILFPNSSIRFCSFHVGQAWKKKMERLGLKIISMNRNSKDGVLLRKVYGLKALDQDLVRPCFNEVFKNSDTKNEKVREFFEYMEEYYIKEDAQFPIHAWANSTSTEYESSTNGCESFHSGFTFPSDKPNLFYFLEKLKKKERSGFRKSWSGVNPRKNRTVKHPELLSKLRNKTISFVQFLTVASPSMAKISVSIHS